MKCIHQNALFLVVVFQGSCGQSQTTPPQDNIRSGRAGCSGSQLKKAATSGVPVSMVRNVKQGKLTMGVFGLDPEVGCIVMMERPYTDFKSAAGQQ